MVKACDIAAEEEDGADVFSVKGRKYISASKEEESPLLYIERVRMSGPGERRELQIFCLPPLDSPYPFDLTKEVKEKVPDTGSRTACSWPLPGLRSDLIMYPFCNPCERLLLPGSRTSSQ